MSAGSQAVALAVDRPNVKAYVRFERVAIEDVPASKAQGKYVPKDVDYALITPAYSKDIIKLKIPQWLSNLKQDVDNQRIPQEWADLYKRQYEMWLNGQEMPLQGTPIKGWGVISPAQQEILLRMNVLTVEDLDGINAEGIQRIGMGGVDLKNKAHAWLEQLKDKGPLTLEIAALKAENELHKKNIESLTEQVKQLVDRVGQPVSYTTKASPESYDISVEDIIEPAPSEHDQLVALHIKKFGKPPHHLLKDESIAKRIGNFA